MIWNPFKKRKPPFGAPPSSTFAFPVLFPFKRYVSRENVKDSWVPTIKEIVHLIVTQQYDTLIRLGYEISEGCEGIKETTNTFGPFIEIPDNAMINAHVYRHKNSGVYLVDLPMWHDGRESPVTLSLEIIENIDGTTSFRIENFDV